MCTQDDVNTHILCPLKGMFQLDVAHLMLISLIQIIPYKFLFD